MIPAAECGLGLPMAQPVVLPQQRAWLHTVVFEGGEHPQPFRQPAAVVIGVDEEGGVALDGRIDGECSYTLVDQTWEAATDQ